MLLIDNPMLKPAPRYDFELAYRIVGKGCGCGQIAKYMVYEDENEQAHCQKCMLEAVDCAEYVQVRRL
ncbi:hypothetical protein [Paenibacillus spongiae]|uniref:Uncharacterized protein n=1 Tax=Paenibacillus spongiae TaxID=2909671 RepID=A0ABY5SEN9_9BACL|nr:hypothetical protein [Paenibacillus spongiae]UVI31180.1 hypothetical protein L1F29_04880 [Paenibacillus spongiae]